jgi:transposase
MTLEASVHAFRLRVIARAQALGNVSQACREFGISRTLFYRWRRRYLAYGPHGLYPKRPGPSRGRPPTLSVEAERALLAVALAHPTWGPARIGAHLARPEHGGWNLAPATIYRFLRRVGLQTRYKRLAVLEVLDQLRYHLPAAHPKGVRNPLHRKSSSRRRATDGLLPVLYDSLLLDPKIQHSFASNPSNRNIAATPAGHTISSCHRCHVSHLS